MFTFLTVQFYARRAFRPRKLSLCRPGGPADGWPGHEADHRRDLTMLPGGTPASLCIWRYSAASASRSGASRPAGDAMLVVAGVLGGGLPRAIVSHRAFDGEHAAVVVGDDQVEGRGRIRNWAWRSYASIRYGVTTTSVLVHHERIPAIQPEASAKGGGAMNRAGGTCLTDNDPSGRRMLRAARGC